MGDGVDDLPDDPAELKRMITEQKAAIAERERIIAERENQIEVMKQRHKMEMDAILRRFYGPRSESFDPRQLLIFGQMMTEELPVDPVTAEAESGEKLVTRKIRHKHGRRKLPEHLPRFEVIHDLPDREKSCPCCNQPRSCIGSEDAEQLEFIPASLKVIVHKRMKYACKKCDANGDGAHIAIADKPDQPIDKGLPGPGLLAHIIVSKLGDHLPLYRLESIFARQDIQIARSTMCSWMQCCSELVKPLIDLMRTRVKKSKVIHTDDTTVKVQDHTLTGRCRTGRIWCYLGDESNPYDVFDYTPDRKREHPQKFLDDFSGYLQADAYGGYDGIYVKGHVHEVACWAHARRKFFEAKETDSQRAGQMLKLVQRLYHIERAIKARIDGRLKTEPSLSRADQHDLTRTIRQKRSITTLAKIKQWLDAESHTVLPRSPMGLAIQYAQNQWDALCRYAEQGYLNIDNNAAERALKRVAIGRKNWLFAGNDHAGASHARLYTLIASAQRHGLDPQKYLMSILAKIGQTKLSELGQFLPDKWKAESAAEGKPTGS